MLDVRVLINDDMLLQEGAASAFREYNTEQFITVQVPGQEYEVG